jgi:hypothetical protein
MSGEKRKEEIHLTGSQKEKEHVILPIPVNVLLSNKTV